MTDRPSHPLDPLFFPARVAVIGASPKPEARANQWIEGYLHMGFQGQLYPVHPTAEHILGYRAYPRVRDIPEPLDLAVFCVPSGRVLPVLEDCAANHTRFVHLYTAGFSETGREENAALEREVLALARGAGIRLLGPNCMGVYCPEGHIAWGREFPTTPGPVGLVSQSGQLAGQFVTEAGAHGLAFSKVVSFGNATDLQAHEFFEYLAQDEKTTVIASYLEGLKDGREFFEFARRTTRNKPVVVWKGGQTEGGSRATRSHTGSIAGSQKIWQALCHQAGVISVDTMEELLAAVTGLLKLPLPRGVRVAVLGGAGGGSVTMTDLAEKEGLRVPKLSDATIRSLEEFVPLEGSSVSNPLDIMGALRRGQGEDRFMTLFRLLRDDPNVDALLYHLRIDWILRRGGRALIDRFVGTTVEGLRILEKPALIVVGRGQSLEDEAARLEAEVRLTAAGAATFDTFPLAARVLAHLDAYRRHLESSGQAGRTAAGPSPGA